MYFSTAAERQSLAKAIARSVAGGEFRPQPVDLWILESSGKSREAHSADYADHVVGSALFKLLTHNARCHGMPGVYSYLSGVTNVGAMQTFAAFVRAHRERVGVTVPRLYVLQSDFEKYGDIYRSAPTRRCGESCARSRRSVARTAKLVRPQGSITALVRPVVRESDGTQFTRLKGVAMGTPLVPLLGNLAVVPMDEAITSIDGILSARYNDDFIIAHSDLATLHEADARIDSLIDELGVKRKLSRSFAPH